MLQYKGHWITTTRGDRQHNILKATFTGSATGWDSGEAYDVVTREFSRSNNGYGSDGILDSGEELQRIRMGLLYDACDAVSYVQRVRRAPASTH